MRAACALLIGFVWAGSAAAQTAWLDRLDRALAVESPGGLFRADLSGLFDLEAYYIDRRPPGLIFGEGDSLANPRLRLFLDARLGTHLYGFVQGRLDRGFDPRERTFSARLDEYFVRYTPLDDPRVNLQVGKFATVFGNWVPRHDSWNNPLINAPLPYENVTIVADATIPMTPAELLLRRNLPDRKRAWLPVIWGPNYTSGAAIFGHLGRFDYAAEVKNAALSARPHEWDGTVRTWSEPTASGRLGWRPAPPWTLGVSFSSGPYLREEAERGLPADEDTGDFRETVAGADASFAWRHWQLWAEFFAARFEVPSRFPICRGCAPPVTDADTAAYYLEARYKVTPKLFAALRWNQQLFADVSDGRGGDHPWDRDVWRVDTALGYRFDRHLQAKLQYSYTRQVGDLQQGEQLVAAQVTVKF
jgi:hypothetical protein